MAEHGVSGAIVIVAYNDVAHLRRALQSCAEHADSVPVTVVDNASRDGTADVVRSEFPQASLLALPRNVGYGQGCNLGIAAAKRDGASWVMLLNQDAVLCDGTVQRLASFLGQTPRAAAVQPAIMRPDGRCNSLGNPLHYLGFSFAGGNGLTLDEAEHDPALPWLHDGTWREGAVVPIVSGAAVLMRIAALDDVGGFEPELFLYHEDFELSLRLRERGWSLQLLGSAVVQHDYSFSRNPDKMYHLERNRHWVLAVHYRVRTLAALMPALMAAEARVWVEAAQGGWAGEKLRSYLYWSNAGKRGYARRRRRAVQRRRIIGDAELLSTATALMRPDAAAPHSVSASDRLSAWIWAVFRRVIR